MLDDLVGSGDLDMSVATMLEGRTLDIAGSQHTWKKADSEPDDAGGLCSGSVRIASWTGRT